MENRPVRKRPQRSRYSYNKKYKNNPNETTRLGNQISAAIILCVFVLIIAYTNSSATKNLRDRTAAIISRNVLNEFEDKGNIKDNITGFVKCMSVSYTHLDVYKRQTVLNPDTLHILSANIKNKVDIRLEKCSCFIVGNCFNIAQVNHQSFLYKPLSVSSYT